MQLWSMVADESAARCCTSATRDRKTVAGRFEHEGMSFLTITLPAFGKDFERGLDQESVSSRHYAGFRRGGGPLPLFLGGFLELVFDRHSGVLLDSPSIDAIIAVRQLTLMFGKMFLPCSNARMETAMQDYVECDSEVALTDTLRSPAVLADFRRVSSMLFSRVFTDVDRSIYNLSDLVPKHGPGATADKLSGNAKWNQRAWPVRLERVLPAGEILLPNWKYYDQLESIDFIEPEAETPVKVIAVPKTQKSPRIIGIEPTAMQYAQQTILPMFVNGVKRSDTLSHVIGFDDQVPNQDLARRGSLTGSLATLDLSEASDRVSWQLVQEMVAPWPHLREALDATRSRNAAVPGHGVIPLAKYSSMGSGLCFPVEMLVFTTAIFMGIEEALGHTLSRRQIDQICKSGEVRVYGDDIIVPVEYVLSVVRSLQRIGASVNVRKSFWTGGFRESCGKEYYRGQDVSIVRVRQLFPSRRTDATEVISLVSLRNQLYFAGYWQTCRWLDGMLRKMLRHFPVVYPTSPVLGRHSFLDYHIERNGVHDRSPLVKGYVVSSEPPADQLEGPGALLKCLLMLELRDGGFFDDPEGSKSFRHSGVLVVTDHLERSGRPRAVNIKLRNAMPY